MSDVACRSSFSQGVLKPTSSGFVTALPDERTNSRPPQTGQVTTSPPARNTCAPKTPKDAPTALRNLEKKDMITVPEKGDPRESGSARRIREKAQEIDGFLAE